MPAGGVCLANLCAPQASPVRATGDLAVEESDGQGDGQGEDTQRLQQLRAELQELEANASGWAIRCALPPPVAAGTTDDGGAICDSKDALAWESRRTESALEIRASSSLFVEIAEAQPEQSSRRTESVLVRESSSLVEIPDMSEGMTQLSPGWIPEV